MGLEDHSPSQPALAARYILVQSAPLRLLPHPIPAAGAEAEAEAELGTVADIALANQSWSPARQTYCNAPTTTHSKGGGG